MTRAVLLIFGMLLPSSAHAQVPTPDPVKVTTISEAAKICGFDEAGLQWREKDSKTIEVWLPVSEIQALSTFESSSPKFSRLRDCFFPWAYDRKVKVNLTVGEKTP